MVLFDPALVDQQHRGRRLAVGAATGGEEIGLGKEIRPGDAHSCFAFEDDYSFGVMQSNPHWQWFLAKCSKFKSDFRYTPESVFDTFPWPQSPTKKQIDAVASAVRLVRKVRAEAISFR